MNDEACKVPEGMHQFGVLIKGGGIDVDNYIKEEEARGYTCVDCGEYVMVCKPGKAK